MTYCVGLQTDAGLIFMSDTRTNAGVDNISTYRKMFNWTVPGERSITLLTAGNLATTQAVISTLEERTKAPEERNPSILEAPTMFQAAKQVGEVLRSCIKRATDLADRGSNGFGASLILGGQIAGMPPRMFLIYPEGNFVETTPDNPFFQIGETKYGRPILVRAYDPKMSFEDAAKLLFVSFDSSIKANLSVGMPLDLQVIETDKLDITHERRIEHNHEYFSAISDSWSEALRNAFHSLPDYSFD